MQVTNTNEDPFDELMETVGYDGRFSKIFRYTFILGLTFCGAMIYMNIILALNVPDHWCYVPGIEKTNLTIKEWRELTLPTQKDNRGAEKFSFCEMYNKSYEELLTIAEKNQTSTIGCVNGYQYDREYYDESIPIRENWVCEKDLYVTNSFVTSRVTEVVGTILLGQLGDIYGRRIIYYSSVIVVFIGRALSNLTTFSFTIFIITTGIAGFAINGMFQSPVIIGMEISKEDDRAQITMMMSLGWTTATTFMPLIYWWTRHWISFMWITTIPTILILFFSKYMIESPRWLISQKRYAEAHVQFTKIAKVNGKNFSVSVKEIGKMFENVKEESVYGIASLFSGWRLAKNTMIMGFSWCTVGVSYFTLVLFSSKMGGNPFFNFLLQSAVEIPAYILGKFLGDRIGRKLTTSITFLISTISCIPILLIGKDPSYENVMLTIATFIKFLNGITFFVVGLQTMEVYPTCLRQTGSSLGIILCNLFGSLAPYFVYLGQTYDIRAPYLILGSLFLTGSVGAMFLPETLHSKLPDTIAEAQIFGKDQKFWSLPKRKTKLNENDLVEIEKLNK